MSCFFSFFPKISKSSRHTLYVTVALLYRGSERFFPQNFRRIESDVCAKKNHQVPTKLLPLGPSEAAIRVIYIYNGPKNTTDGVGSTDINSSTFRARYVTLASIPILSFTLTSTCRLPPDGFPVISALVGL